MSQAVKAALLSGLIFPGVGQISVGHKKRGWLIVGTHLLFLFLIIKEVLHKAKAVIAEIQQSGAVINIEVISKTTSDMVSFSDNSYVNILFVFFLLGWFVSVLDAYRLGNK